MTTYPEALDSDLELPRATDDVTELSVDLINSLRDAIIAIQGAVGLNPQGQKSSLTERINVSIDSNGFIKKSALDNIGLVTLPVTNIHIGPTAGIEESKLALDYTTASLKGLLDSMRIDMTGLIAGFSTSTNAANSHFLGLANFHDGYQIKINLVGSTGIAGLEATTVGGALNEIGAYLLSGNDLIEPHIDLGLPSSAKHTAGTISVDSTDFEIIDRTATTVQAALDSIDTSSGIFGVEHLDTFHATGILKEIKSGTYYNANQSLVGPISSSEYTGGSSIVQIPGIASFASLDIKSGDILRIHEQSGVDDVGSYQIRAVGPLVDADTLGDLPTLSAGQVAVFHTFVETRDDVTVSVYKPASMLSESSPLACAVRNNETIVDTISILHPNAARAISVGLNGAIFNSDGYEIHVEAGIGGGVTRGITIPNLNRERLGTNQANPVNSKTIAERINAHLSHPDLENHFPMTAYRVGNELVLAHNWVGSDYTLTIVDGYSGNFAAGFDAHGANVLGKVLIGNEDNNFVVNGNTRSTIRTLFDGYSSITADTDTLTLWTNSGEVINPLLYGIRAGSVMHISGHHLIDTNGSYTLLAANSSTVSVFNVEEISSPHVPTRFNVKFTDADVPLTELASSESDHGLVQVHIDSGGRTMLHQRLTYGTNLGAGVEFINVSSGFPAGDVTIIVGLNGNDVTFNIIDDTLYGETVEFQDNFRGTFKLYHPNGLDYLVVRVASGVISGGIDVVNVTTPLTEDEAMLLCTAYFDGTLSINNLVDERLFGNLGIDQIRDDFVEIFSQRSVSDLRSDGIVRGFDILNTTFYDSVAGTQAVPLRGGIAYVNGVRVAVETQKVTIQSYDTDGNLIFNAQRIIAINEFGSIQVVSDELGEVLTDGYVASAAFGRLLPLYRLDVINGGIGNVVDIRRFINNIDDKIEIIVDETNNVVGNFRTLEGALLFADKYPSKEKLVIRIINSVFLDNPVVVPDGVAIVGGAPYGGDSKHQIINHNMENESYLITLNGNNRLENVEIISQVVGLGGPLVYINGSNVVVEQCLFRFDEEITTNSGDIAIEVSRNATKNIRIADNKIDNVYSGIVSLYGSEDLLITNNVLTNISGTGGNSYGIRVGSSARAINNVIISDNSVRVPSVVSGTDLRGISIDVGFNIDIARLMRNSIVHEAQNTMTNGVRVDVLDGYTGVIDQLFVSDNVIDGIKLDDNYVYGIYVTNANRTIIRDNILKNIGVDYAGRIETAVIKVASTFGFAEIINNVLQDSNVVRGIEIETQSQTSRIKISGNTINNVGKSAYYIRGSTSNSVISDNVLVGPGLVGIRWNGTSVTITGNNLSRPNTLAVGDTADDYAFQNYAIYAPSSDIDITNNTITGMIYSGSIGITNAGAARNRMKILDNTISGSLMSTILEIYGSDHVINNNKLSNDVLNTTLGMELNSTSNCLIMGNMFRGAISYAITSSATSASNLTIANNSNIATTNVSSISFTGTTTNCLVVGNRFPEGSVIGDNVIGATPSFGVYNTNVMGINLGLQDSRGLHASAGITAHDSNGTGTEHPHWTINDTNGYWEVNSEVTADARHLYFPVSDLPNGAKLDSVQVQGKIIAVDGVFSAQLFKRSVKAVGLTVTAISGLQNMSAPATDDFGNDDALTTGTVDVTTVGGEVINYQESNYYLQIIHTGAAPTSASDIRVYGVTVNFEY